MQEEKADFFGKRVYFNMEVSNTLSWGTNMALVIEIKVVPQSGRSGFVLDKSGKLKCYLKSPAERGLANSELVKTIAKTLGLAQDKVTLVSGQTSRNKRVKIDAEMTLEQVIAKVGIEKQQSLF